MPSALLPSHNSASPPRAIGTLIGRGNNRPSLRTTPPCGTSLLAGRQSYQDFLSCFPSHQRTSFSEIQELAGKGRLHTTDDGTVLLVRKPTPQPPPDSQRPVGRAACLLNDEPIRVYVPLLMRPCVMQAFATRQLPATSAQRAHFANARTF